MENIKDKNIIVDQLISESEKIHYKRILDYKRLKKTTYRNIYLKKLYQEYEDYYNSTLKIKMEQKGHLENLIIYLGVELDQLFITQKKKYQILSQIKELKRVLNEVKRDITFLLS